MTVSISGTNGLTMPDSSVQSTAAIGCGQTWQDVTASRAKNTTYTNSTGRPIQVSVSINWNGTGSNSQGYLQVGSVIVSTATGDGGTYMTATVSGIIPPGATYIVTLVGAQAVRYWTELR